MFLRVFHLLLPLFICRPTNANHAGNPYNKKNKLFITFYRLLGYPFNNLLRGQAGRGGVLLSPLAFFGLNLPFDSATNLHISGSGKINLECGDESPLW